MIQYGLRSTYSALASLENLAARNRDGCVSCERRAFIYTGVVDTLREERNGKIKRDRERESEREREREREGNIAAENL